MRASALRAGVLHDYVPQGLLLCRDVFHRHRYGKSCFALVCLNLFVRPSLDLSNVTNLWDQAVSALGVYGPGRLIQQRAKPVITGAAQTQNVLICCFTLKTFWRGLSNDWFLKNKKKEQKMLQPPWTRNEGSRIRMLQYGTMVQHGAAQQGRTAWHGNHIPLHATFTHEGIESNAMYRRTPTTLFNRGQKKKHKETAGKHDQQTNVTCQNENIIN